MRRRSRRWLALGAMALAAVAVGGCGNDTPPYTKDCCVNGSLYYVCTDQLSYGQCSSIPAVITAGCSYRAGLACPSTTP